LSKHPTFLPSIEVGLVSKVIEDKEYDKLRGFRVFKEELPKVQLKSTEFVFDLEKLKRFFTPQIKVESIVNGHREEFLGEVKPCSIHDFEAIMHKSRDEVKSLIENRFCINKKGDLMS
jgi:3-deoxy-D-arabino-heptulosonate 7-phosphate (DAHP) synthase